MASSVLVLISGFEWTMRALHLACAISRNTHATLVLLQLRPVSNPALLGSGMGVGPISASEYEEQREYRTVAEDYGVDFKLQSMVYISQVDALVQAAAANQASVVFARLSKSSLPFRDRLQRWNLQRQLAIQGCQLCTLDANEQSQDGVSIPKTTPGQVKSQASH